MANQGKKKRIWILVKRLDLDGQIEELKEVQLFSDDQSSEVDQTIRTTFSISEKLVLKLRNHRGSLIPINANITANTKNLPYILEVVHIAQNIQPESRTIEWPSYNEGIAANLQNIVNRVEKLEGSVPDLENKRCNKISHEIEDMDKKLDFLSRRFEEADNTSWKGMFKRHPLW